jgi:hypothetical protein
MVYQGHVVGGVIVLDDSVRLPEGASVQVTLAEPAPVSEESAAEGPTMAESIEKQIAAIVAEVPANQWARLPKDLSDQLDHYIYGTPKR